MPTRSLWSSPWLSSRSWTSSRAFSTSGRLQDRPRRRIVSALNPESLTPADYVDCVGANWVTLNFPGLKPGESGPTVVYSRQQGGRPNPFPDHTRGFIYYAPHPGLPPESASLRFRCTASHLPSSFESGYDLLTPEGVPWQTLGLQATVGYPLLRTQLLQEELITPEFVAKWGKLLGGRIYPARMLFALHQAFPVNFAKQLHVHLVCPHEAIPLHLQSIFDAKIPRTNNLACHPFTGSGLAHFEPSPTDPQLMHLRIDRIIEPVRALVPWIAENAAPREGELLQRFVRDGRSTSPWSLDLLTGRKNAMAMRKWMDGS
ncbi:hypothetical protein FB45DRAFT_34965 [Roridomyces roridus]|uniref:Uncharacterized protein n=1 Tax=Roridomyces roridus TaxID=1738132 RepID=A0AAD7CNI6_9AGAR|nr:hypothetical protein FB45DRAFT_34965 [Roridomyces roridus]